MGFAFWMVLAQAVVRRIHAQFALDGFWLMAPVSGRPRVGELGFYFRADLVWFWPLVTLDFVFAVRFFFRVSVFLPGMALFFFFL
ncbi:hypothetical protein SK79_01211 [Escherichia coli]|nr:hypothetical protein SK79_01211 [Escherichia coli]